MKKTVKYTLNATAPLTEQQRAEIKAASELPDSGIDYSDIPALPADFLKIAAANPFYKPTKTSTTVRVDTDVLVWLKSQGKGYQTRINEILRAAMLQQIKH